MDIIASQVNEYRKINDHHMWMANIMNHFGTVMVLDLRNHLILDWMINHELIP